MSRLLTYFLGGAAFLFAGPVLAQSQPIKVDIDAQPVGDALNQFAEQSGLQVALYADDAKGIDVVGVSGQFDDVTVALDSLLASTGLEYSFINDRTVAVASVQKIAKEGGNSRSGNARRAGVTPRPVMMAQASETNRVEETSARSEADRSVRTSDGSVVIEEIVVTAQKREERLQDVPISMTVLGGAELDRARVQGLTELLRDIPGVGAPITALGAPIVTIRGVAPPFLAFGGSTTASYYIDSVPYGFVRSALMPDADLYDLDRIEVLRGPQGTLFGANAQSGVVRLLTHDPTLSDFEWKGRGSVSSTENGGTNYRGDLAVNVPLMEEKLAARAVVGYKDRSGWIDKPGRPNADASDASNVRLKVKGQLTERLSLMGSGWVSRTRLDTQSLGDDDGNNTVPGLDPVKSDSDVYELRANYDAGAVQISSATSYFDYELASTLDLSPLGPFFNGLIQEVNFQSRVLSEELTFTSIGQDPWRWSAGASYRDVNDRFRQHFSNVLAADYEDFSESWAVFGELTRVFFDGKLELTGGLRYFEDDQEVAENVSSTGNPATPLVHSQASFDAVTPRAVLTLHPNDDLMFYASYSEGFRSGLLQQPTVLVVAPLFPTAKPDRLHNYEIGTKGSLGDGRLRYDASVFYLDWQDIQRTASVAPGTNNPALTAVVNATSASGVGYEFAATLALVERLIITGSYSWNDLAFDSDVVNANTGALVFQKGSRLGSSPESTASLSVDYSFSVGRGFDLLTSLSGNYTSGIESTQLVDGIRVRESDGESILMSRASVMLSAPENWTLTLFVDNVGNETDPTTRGSFPPTWWSLNTRPRTFGLQVEFRR